MSLFLELIGADLCVLIIKKIDILILGKWPTQGLDDTALRAEAQYLVNFSRSNRKLCIIMGATVFYLLMLQK